MLVAFPIFFLNARKYACSSSFIFLMVGPCILFCFYFFIILFSLVFISFIIFFYYACHETIACFFLIFFLCKCLFRGKTFFLQVGIYASHMIIVININLRGYNYYTDLEIFHLIKYDKYEKNPLYICLMMVNGPHVRAWAISKILSSNFNLKLDNDCIFLKKTC